VEAKSSVQNEANEFSNPLCRRSRCPGQDWDGMEVRGETRYAEQDVLGGKAILISCKNTYAPTLVERYELTANVTTPVEWNVNVS